MIRWLKVKIQKHTNNRQYAGFLLSYFFIVFMVILIVSLAISFSIQKILVNKIYDAQLDSLNTVIFSMNRMYENMRTTSYQLYFDADIAKLRNLQSPQVADVNSAMTRLSMYGTLFQDIKSMYIYSDIAQTAYIKIPSTNSSLILGNNEFFDIEVRDRLVSGDSIKELYPIKRDIPIISEQSISYVKGFTFYFFAKSRGTKGVDEGVVVLNVSDEMFMSLFSQFRSESGAYCMIQDTNNQFIIGYGEEEEGFPIDDPNVLVSNSIDQEKGYFILNKKSENFLVTYAKYKPFDWTIYKVVPFNSFFEEIMNMRLNILLISFAMLVIALVIVYLISQKVYTPFQLAFTRLSRLENEVDRTRKTDLLHKIVLIRDKSNHAEVVHEFGSVKTALKAESPIFLVYFAIDQYTQFCTLYSHELRENKRNAMIEIIATTLAVKYDCESIDMGNNHVIAMVSERIEEIHVDRFVEMIRDIQKSIKQEALFTVTAIVSKTAESIFAAGVLYDQVSRKSLDRFFHEPEAVIWCDDDEMTNTSNYRYPIKIEKKMTDSLLSGNIKMAEEYFTQILREAANQSYFTMRFSLQRLTAAVCAAVNVIEENLQIGTIVSWDNLMMDIEKTEHLLEIEQYFGALFQQMHQKLENHRESRQPDLVNEINGFINKYYCETDFSISFVADKMKKSAAYIGTIYKKMTHKSIIDYMNERRIEKAKSLLAETDKHIYEIGEMVGYTNIQHFHRIFKRYSGATPNEFRKAIVDKNGDVS